jgi:hypothetical protein
VRQSSPCGISLTCLLIDGENPHVDQRPDMKSIARNQKYCQADGFWISDDRHNPTAPNSWQTLLPKRQTRPARTCISQPIGRMEME